MGILIGNPPSASILMNSMRSMGYTLEAAMADVIDNSISANAKNIWIEFPKDPRFCYITICDDGHGMSKKDLFEAMKYGSAISSDNRAEEDLGRFGLGLKSASLSQCKKLTVASKFNGSIHAYIWDIDLVGNDWLIQECTLEEIDNIYEIQKLKGLEHGTLIVWEKFDIIEKSFGVGAYTALNARMDDVCRYLELIFHRFLNGDANSLSIKMGEYSLIGLDPFLEKHNKTTPKKEMKIPITDSTGVERLITVKPFILPYQKYLAKSDMEKLGGIDSYHTKQGFYVYRNKRLIIWGTWFRMKPKHELTNQARIRVDIPNMLDDIWGIDIKKQNATLPNAIKNQLIKAVEETMGFAIKAQRFRGRVSNAHEDIDYIWDRYLVRDQKYEYRINRNSKIFQLLNSVSEESKRLFDLVLDEIERNLPYQQIYLDMSDHIIDDTVNDDKKADILNKARILIDSLSAFGRDKNEIIEELFLSEPFSKYPEMKRILQEELTNE